MTVFESNANHAFKETSLAFKIQAILITVFSVTYHVGKELIIRYSGKSFNNSFTQSDGFQNTMRWFVRHDLSF